MAQSPFSKRPLSEWIVDLEGAASPDDRYRALLAINSLGSLLESISGCRCGLIDADSGVRALAAKQLGERKRQHDARPQPDSIAIWREVAAELQRRLIDDDPDVRFEAARALGQVCPESTFARDVLLALLDAEGTQPLMLAVVVSALGERRDCDVAILVPRLRMLLSHPQAEVRENSSGIVAGWETGAAELVTELLVCLEDDEPIVRENAAIALGRAGNNSPQVLTALQSASSDEDEGVAEAARQAHREVSRP